MYVNEADGGVGSVPETANGKTIKTMTAQNNLQPIYKLQWIALWKGLFKLRETMKNFQMSNFYDNAVVTDVIFKEKSCYYLDKIKNVLSEREAALYCFLCSYTG
eukprot:GHVP01036545.1.p1 GENE.GHVP01036545.1~~GHVP01036545.1.p1  ORF type:complete len:104 (-),score=9.75 GHVP01036545.1:126-437(-)